MLAAVCVYIFYILPLSPSLSMSLSLSMCLSLSPPPPLSLCLYAGTRSYFNGRDDREKRRLCLFLCCVVETIAAIFWGLTMCAPFGHAHTHIHVGLLVVHLFSC